MRTNVTLDQDLVDELLALTEARTKTAAVAFAVREQIRRAKLARLAALLGHVPVDEAALASGARADRDRSARLAERRGKYGR